jgi:hypothetical protein
MAFDGISSSEDEKSDIDCEYMKTKYTTTNLMCRKNLNVSEIVIETINYGEIVKQLHPLV